MSHLIIFAAVYCQSLISTARRLLFWIEDAGTVVGWSSNSYLLFVTNYVLPMGLPCFPFQFLAHFYFIRSSFPICQLSCNHHDVWSAILPIVGNINLYHRTDKKARHYGRFKWLLTRCSHWFASSMMVEFTALFCSNNTLLHVADREEISMLLSDQLPRRSKQFNPAGVRINILYQHICFQFGGL